VAARNQQRRATEHAARPPHCVALLGVGALRFEQAGERLVDPPGSTGLGREVEQRTRPFALEAEVARDPQLLLAQLTRLVEQVEGEVRLDEVEARADGERHALRLFEHIGSSSQEVDRGAVPTLTEGKAAEVDVDASNCAGGPDLRVLRAGSRV
jgi:hypothetical protein